MEVARNCAALRLGCPVPRGYSSLLFATGRMHWRFAISWHVLQILALGVLPAAYMLSWGHDEVYTMLWSLVFGFATLNILGLGARRFEQEKPGLSFGEMLAVLVVLVSVLLLGWEMLYLFHVLPFRVTPQ